MSSGVDLFQRVLRLSDFDGDSREAMRTLHRYFASDFPECSLALLLVRDQPPGRCRLAGLIGPDGVEHVANVDPNGEHSALPSFEDTLAQNILANNAPHVVPVPEDLRDMPLAHVLFAPSSVLAMPVANRGRITHWLVFGSTVAHRFDRIDLNRTVLHVNLATSLLIRTIALRELTRRTERQRLEIESLADIQRLLLPDNPKIAGLDYAMHWQPAETAAGDYYEMTNLTEFAPPDFVPNGNDVWGVIVGDVSGHGAAAAMEAVQLDAILRTYKGGDGPPPAAAVSYINKYFFSRRNRGHFLTLVAGTYRPDTRTLSYLSAGHPPLMLRRGNQVQLLGEADQIPIGVLRDYQFRNNEIVLQTGDTLVLYTDGIVEARDADANMFGAERLSGLIEKGPVGAKALLDSIVKAVHDHQGSLLGTDDQTLIVLTIAH
ncbi:MAG TPA: PP2C family protein-serine/threonine phosphatase [Rudaea sp.]|nr:PP2C family protein-serine/threonine phosphatase [Rudaea sp.]